MIGGWVKQNNLGHHNVWMRLAFGPTLPPPEGTRWPSPLTHSQYYSGRGYECHANFYTPEKFIEVMKAMSWGKWMIREVNPILQQEAIQ